MTAAENDRPDDWRIYRGATPPHDGMERLPEPPPWRRFTGGPLVVPRYGTDLESQRRLGRSAFSGTYRPDEHVVDMINTALYLRKPLLVTGSPGSGKSTLAYSVSEELKLGPVLHWPVTSRSTLADAQYRYDAIGRLQDANLARAGDDTGAVTDIGRFVRLGPLGTALVPQERPRVLLIDEIDKSDVDLPSDLLHILDTGEFVIPELARLPDDQADVDVLTADGMDRVTLRHGLVRCHAFPVVIITSNGERALPPAFLRRCLLVEIQKPDREQLRNIIEAQLGSEALERSERYIELFLERGTSAELATDQLINAIFLATSTSPPEDRRDKVIDAIFADLGSLT